MKFINIKNLKILISFSVVFFLLILSNYLINRQLLHDTIFTQQKDAVKGVSTRIGTWFQQKIDSTEAIRDFLIKMDHTNELKIKNFILRSTNVANFENIYVGYDDDTIISGVEWKKPKNYITTNRPWYKSTINKDEVIVTSPYVDMGLKKLVVSICTPFKENISDKSGVVCGILPLDKIKEEILDISLPYDGFAFIVNYLGKIILHPDSNKDLTISGFKTLSANKYFFIDKKEELYLFYQEKIKFSNWHIVAQLKKSSVYEKINFQLFINLAIYGISLLVFLLLNFFYYRNQRDSDESLKKTKSILNHYIQHGDNGVLIIDDKDKIIFKNKLFKNILQLEEIKEKVLDKKTQIFSLLSFEMKKEIINSIKDAKINYESKEILIALNEEEDSRYFLFEVFPVLSKEEVYQGVIILIKDVSKKMKASIEKKEYEDILFQQSKMADLGEMIAAVSHQWRQPLNSLSIMIGNLLQFKRLNNLTDKVFEENLTYSLSNIHYLADTIDTFRNFYKPNKKWQTFTVDNAIEEVSEILEPQFKNSGIKLLIEKIEYEDCSCLNYKNEFQQIIANLLQNANDAILEDKNSLKEIKIHIRYEKYNYYIEVSDYGIGIPSEMESKMFQPFQTTKKEKGTGTGLYLSRLIVRKKLNGDLTIVSFVKPTTFLITLPCNAKD